MKKFSILGVAVLLSLGLVLTGCPTDSDDNLIKHGERFISGIFNDMKFVAYKAADGRSARAISSEEDALVGFLQDGSTVYGLEGYYDEDSGNFILTGAGDNAGFAINGYVTGENKGARGKSWKKNSTKEYGFDASQSDVNIDGDVTFNETESATRAPKIPAKFRGKWDYSNIDNAQAAEMYNSSWGEPGEFCMVITGDSITLWVDMESAIQKEIDYMDESDAWMTENGYEPTFGTPEARADYLSSMIKTFTRMMYTYQILEIDNKADYTDVTIMYQKPYDDDPEYGDDPDNEWKMFFRIIRLAETQDGIKATLGTGLVTDPVFTDPLHVMYQPPETPGGSNFPPTNSEEYYEGVIWESWGGMSPASVYLTNFVDAPQTVSDPDNTTNLATLYMKKFD